jgi:hypothetical protein
VGNAIAQMDQATQQNAALVEEMAAAAASLKNQAQDLVQVVAVFKLDVDHSRPMVRSQAPTAKPFKAAAPRSLPAAKVLPKAAPKPAAAPAPVAKKPAQLPTPSAPAKSTPAGGDDDWETF